jgi:hypothetical protein
MGYTGKTIELIDLVIDKVQTVIDLGAQNDYRSNYFTCAVCEKYLLQGKRQAL